MLGGYAGKILDIDLTDGKITELKIEENVLRQYIGGRGLGARILWDRLGSRWEKVDPLSPENLLLVLTGPLTGYFHGARICITGKSPQSNGIIGSTVSGEFPIELKCSGWDGIIVSGRAEKPVYILVNDENVEIKSAEHVWGKTTKTSLRMLTKEVKEELDKRHARLGIVKEPAAIYIGPAGENRVRSAAVEQKWSHAAGYGGYGAVMGSKNLKAILAKGTGPLPPVARPEEVKQLIQEYERLALSRDRIRRWGTGYSGYEVGAKTSSEPVRNWQEEWHDKKTIGGDRFDLRYWVKRYWGDYGCAITCMKLATVKAGPYKGAITDNPDYELEAYLGPNLGIFDAGAIIYLSSLIEDLGFSGINGGNILAFATELYQRGILTKDDLDGLELGWGNVDAIAELAKRIARRDGKYFDILAEGTYRAALKISELKGVNVLPYAVHVKGVEVGAHGTRSDEDYTHDICYACSVQGGDHTSTVNDAYGDMLTVFQDSAVYCAVIAWGGTEGLDWKFLRAVTGWDITEEEWKRELGHRIIHIQRAAELLGGPDVRWKPPKDDDNPPRFYEPLPSGPFKGSTTDKEEVERRKREYYEAIGWDKNGIPKPSVLRKLGLYDVDKDLDRIRKP
ncbi:aldehyde ferredoxin oxidoreductase [Candidatus Bathyarchaeota archaeon ex4484_231]|nr:MAG: aldehyde ferredoxin oxidoreductase [Candidatus Bathyarchaeota archaeon ex4484_231]RJS75646.1 MAG: aldehyde ferredoxin oxidoreductase [Candidatus Bathyarchaeota archaeon]